MGQQVCRSHIAVRRLAPRPIPATKICMKHPDLPLTDDVVLIGGGHTHALVLRKWGMAPVPGARLTVINPGPTAPYSGMLPGHVAGHYERAELDIDLVRLARFAGARLILGAADGIDLDRREVHVPGRPPIGFDLCSVDVGITSRMPSLPGFEEHGVPAKPLGAFAQAWRDFLEGNGTARVAVIGAGVAGAELAMAMAYALRQRGRFGSVTLIDRSGALTATGDKSRGLILEKMRELGVDLVENATIQGLEPGKICLADGGEIAADFVTGAAGARPHDWIAQTGLALTDGFITVDKTLRSSDPAVFAVGDCAHLNHAPRPKAGVFAVREAPILYDNLTAALTQGTIRAYHPQKDYLKLVSLGGKLALGERFGLALSGPLMWRWKDHIDQTFMNQFRDLPAMAPPDLPALRTSGMQAAIGDKPLCGGCGAKVGRTGLRAALTIVEDSGREDITPLPGDDAAVLHTGGARQVMTTDHLRAMTDDPVMMTRIAAHHALGDIWAMGAAPQAATVSLILPRMADTVQQRMLSEIMQAAREVIHAAGAEVVGGHTSIGVELTIGFTLTGLCAKDPITLGGGQVGDALILTKPIGSGVVMAGEMQSLADGASVAAAWAHMTQSQGAASEILSHANAMTDVTGFGLIGHLLGMCETSGVGAELNLNDVPVMEGALALSKDGVKSSIYDDNRALAPEIPETSRTRLLFDPQTAGGLLAAVPADQVDDVLVRLQAAGYPAARIGGLVGGPAQVTVTGA